MALTNADRALDLHALDIRFMCLTPEGATFQRVVTKPGTKEMEMGKLKLVTPIS